ncbi:MAG TPA: hypothetical protein VGX50_17650 [Longimicrobium sp.]|nr:hypothetical protein [Longimicrobium sp.]
MITEPVLQALFSELHRSIEEAATSCVAQITSEGPSITYPPGEELTQADRQALRTLTVSPAARAALHKLVADACSWPVLHLFSLMDGVVDPQTDVGEWYGATLESKREDDDEMLHDEFLEAYSTYKDGR